MRWLFLCLLAAPLHAEGLIAARTLPAKTRITAEDILNSEATLPGAITQRASVEGKEVVSTIYSGQPIYPAMLQDAALVERNQLVRLVYTAGGLAMQTDGRALDRGPEGALIRAMNLSSRTIVMGEVLKNGTISVGGPS
ncbi:MAG: flagellar basal body P-ring formation chaperone FlgA [Pseudomonadota bacterium]|nr:flagellar basal body P-ring formation chaperone FlgA [Pseudomonadota bacterium]